MNEQTTKLIEQMAQKLGTTAEYLWSVLLRQAPISATTTLLQTICVILFGLALWKLHKRFMKKYDDSEYSGSIYSEYEEGAAIPMVIGALAFFILVIVCLACLRDVVNGYCNPEYWALEQILHKCN